MGMDQGVVQLKRGFLNPYMVIGILLVVALIFAGPKIASKLSMIGIADDYLLYDDFERGFLDSQIWGYEGADPSYFHVGGNAYLSAYSTKEAIITAKDIPYGAHIKTKLFARTPACRCSGCSCSGDGYSLSTLIINGKEVYTCGNRNRLGTSFSCFIEVIPSFEKKDIFAVKLAGEDHTVVNLSNPTGDGKVKLKFNINSYGGMSGSLITGAQFLKYKLPYSCKINDDEILIFDSFAAGSSVNISTLSHEPVKFCLDYPIKARSFEEEGIKTDIRGEILQKIVGGESTTVPEDEEWKVYYITKLTDDISLRCDIAEAYDTQTGLCENPGEQYIVGCKCDDDCYIPKNCAGLSATCEQNECSYQGGCIFQPQKESSTLWEKIKSIVLFEWLTGFWN